VLFAKQVEQTGIGLRSTGQTDRHTCENLGPGLHLELLLGNV
jgi:hypothetical protein